MRISLKPSLRVWWSQVDRFDRLGSRRAACHGERADLPRRDPVRRVRLRHDLDARGLQLFSKSYRPRSRRQRGLIEQPHPLDELRRIGHERWPDLLPIWSFERREGLTAPGIQYREPCPYVVGGCLADPGGEGGEGPHRRHRNPERLTERLRRRDPDPKPGERPWSDANADRVDDLPAAESLHHRLDLDEQ